MSIAELDDNYMLQFQNAVRRYAEYLEFLHRQQHANIDVPWMVISHGNILLSLYKHGELTMTEISKYIRKTPPTTTTLVKKLKKEGIVVSRTSDDDNRIHLISLTEKGIGHCDRMEPWLRKFYEVAGSEITEDEVTMVMDVLNRSMNSLMRDMVEKADDK